MDEKKGQTKENKTISNFKNIMDRDTLIKMGFIDDCKLTNYEKIHYNRGKYDPQRMILEKEKNLYKFLNR